MFISMSADWAQPPGKPVKVGESPGWFSYSLWDPLDVRIINERDAIIFTSKATSYDDGILSVFGSIYLTVALSSLPFLKTHFCHNYVLLLNLNRKSSF